MEPFIPRNENSPTGKSAKNLSSPSDKNISVFPKCKSGY
jgi:hypothetical protein